MLRDFASSICSRGLQATLGAHGGRPRTARFMPALHRARAAGQTVVRAAESMGRAATNGIQRTGSGLFRALAVVSDTLSSAGTAGAPSIAPEGRSLTRTFERG